MEPSEFYEKYWKVQDKDGVMKSPAPLRQHEKDFLDKESERSYGKIIKIEDTWHKPNKHLRIFETEEPKLEDADFEVIEPKRLPNTTPQPSEAK